MNRKGGSLQSHLGIFFNIESGNGVDLKCDIPPIIFELCSRSRSQAGLGAAMLNQTLTVYKELYMCST